ncbi:MAG: alpha-amylase family glycosyl hydrolase, partial [Planctomycetaceae bacterium]
MPLSPRCRERVLEKLNRLYGADGPAVFEGIAQLTDRYAGLPARPGGELWSERDIVLITYGDQVRSPGRTPLAALDDFLRESGLAEVINTVHVLPFCPYSSDDGFSVIDYRAVDPHLGTWADVARLGGSFDLMFDLVLNHVSKHSRWFQEFLAGREEYANYFLTMDPSTDLSAVTRPRSTPVLTPFETAAGTQHMWTTFSDDQVDLNFANPAVLLEMLDVLLLYIERGARIIRLDAIAYLWKTPGTSSIHLPETHTIVKLMRDLVDELAPGTILLTETNVPHAENVSYFGSGDEAQMVYQFSLPPLLLDAFLTGDAGPFMFWLEGLEPPGRGETFFNFT